MRRTSKSLLPLLLLPLAACGQGGTDTAGVAEPATSAPATTSTATSTAVTTATSTAVTTSTASALMQSADTETPGAAYTTGEMPSDAAGAAELTIQDVRAATHDGFDRVVFEYAGTGTPWFHAGYVPEPRQQASGNPLDVAGSAYLEVDIHGTPMASVAPRPDLAAVGPVGVAAGNVAGVTHGGVFEADTQYVIGLDHQRPYQVYTLENPTRVVVEFQQ